MPVCVIQIWVLSIWLNLFLLNYLGICLFAFLKIWNNQTESCLQTLQTLHLHEHTDITDTAQYILVKRKKLKDKAETAPHFPFPFAVVPASKKYCRIASLRGSAIYGGSFGRDRLFALNSCFNAEQNSCLMKVLVVKAKVKVWVKFTRKISTSFGIFAYTSKATEVPSGFYVAPIY